MHTAGFSPSRLFTVRLDPGEDVLLSLREAVRQEGIENGVILSGIGSLARYHFHVVKTARLPPGNTFVAGEGPFDILSITGLILGGRVHAHLTFSNTEVAMGGHMEEGCQVLTFAMITLAEAPGVDFSAWDRVGPLFASE